MPSTADALVLDGPRRLERRTLRTPAVGDDDGLLVVEACGLCGTDHEQFSGRLGVGAPFVPGHESVGRIGALGPVAAERWGVAVGDRVAVEVFQSCRRCEACASGEYRRCASHGLGDMYGFIPVTRAPGLWGGDAEVQYLAPDSMLVPVPEGMDPVLATLFNPLGAGLRWAATLPGTGPGDVVAVLGPGIRGLASVVAAREAGAGFVMVTGLGEQDRPRLAAAADFGADLVVDVAHTDPVRALRDACGQAADVVVDVTATAPGAFAQAQDLARTGGTVVYAGTRGSPEVPGFHPDTMVYKELRLLGALGVDTTSYTAALSLLASGRYPFADLARQVVGFDGLPDLLATMGGETEASAPLHGVFVPG